MVLIDRKKLEEQIKEAFQTNPGVRGMLLHWIRRQKAVDAVPVQHGHWIEKIDAEAKDIARRRFYCSACGVWQTYGRTNYCPNCGAKTDGGNENETD